MRLIVGVPLFFCGVIIIFISGFILFLGVNIPFQRGMYHGVSSFFNAIILIATPRLIYSLIISYGIVFLFYKLILNKSTRGVKFVILISIFLITFFIPIFPKKILALKTFAPPPLTEKATYRYTLTLFGTGELGKSDSARVSFLTNATFDQVIQFYEEAGLFKEGDFKNKLVTTFEDWSGTKTFSVQLRDGRLVEVSIVRDQGKMWVWFSPQL